MNGRRLYREYAKSKSLDCKEFVELKNEQSFGYGSWELYYKDSNNNNLSTPINHKEMVDWIIRTKRIN